MIENNTSQIEQTEPSALRSLLEMVAYMASIIIVVVFVRYVFFSPFAVQGSSMEPNLHSGELIIVNKMIYSNWNGSEPERGDVIVIHPPNDPKKYYIKRVIGLPGETIYFFNGEIFIENDEYPDGIKVEEPYLSADNSKTLLPNNLKNTKIKIDKRNYYVLGDNRKASSDSRSFGQVHKQNIIGRTEVIFYPFDMIRGLEGAEYSL